MLESIAIGGADYEYEVKLRLERDIDAAHIHIGCTNHALSFLTVDSLGRVNDIGGAGLDLDKTDTVTLAGDKVDLNPPYPLIDAVDGIAESEEMVTRHLLTPFAKFVMGRHRRYLKSS